MITQRSNSRAKRRAQIRKAYENVSLMGGICSVFGITGGLDFKLKQPSNYYGKAIRGYWEAIGDDLYDAIQDIETTVTRK